MLSGDNRLKKKKDFEHVFKKGKGFKEGFLFVKLVKNNLKTTRFGFVVGYKVSKKAVLRNKVKRRLREAIKAELPKIRKGLDVVLVADKGFETKDHKETEAVVARLFKKAKIIQ